MNIDELFNESAPQLGVSVGVLRDIASQNSDRSIEYAGEQHTHMFVFKMESNQQQFNVAYCLKFTLDCCYEKLMQIFDVCSTSDISCCLAYSKKAFHWIDKGDNGKIMEQSQELIDELRNAYDFIECPELIVKQSNKAYFEYHASEYVNASDYFSQYYIIFKCTPRKNMRALLRMIYGIFEALGENVPWHNFQSDLAILYNKNSQWVPIRKNNVKFDYVKTVYFSRYYEKNLEDKFIFLYKDIFYQDNPVAKTVNFNSQLIKRFKRIIFDRSSNYPKLFKTYKQKKQ